LSEKLFAAVAGSERALTVNTVNSAARSVFIVGFS